MAAMSRRRRGWIVGASIAAVLAVGGGAAAWLLAPPSADAAPDPTPPTTTPVVSAPLASSIRTPGTIGFADPRDLAASLGGVLTALPAPGTVVGQGQELYRAGDAPVILLRGALPAWRDFASGMEDGPDVQQLEQSLADLGFFDGTIDRQFTDRTEEAIRAWQKANGLDRDGVIPRGRVVFSPADVRVGDPKASIGADVAPGTPLYAASSATPIISAQIPSAQRADVAVGDAAQITLPGGGQSTGTVTAVGSPQEKQDAAGKKQLMIPLTITPDDPAAVAALAPLTAQLTFTRTTQEKVLQVPVAALLAVGPEKYAVEVVRDGKTVEVAIETGRFSSGMVEITGGDLKAGDDVVVPE
ncbi:peptidoglycan hydrolase-like protein with peptidoglycan-binding domain [Microbacterium resistens]|uniref:Peptidoglycan hydrolase-like protein with peptidoglycan-binding domain n=1 Tax=Microbacterium resistens TaxID=156977 RepID=A0ABU1SEH8_9MICO|nr:peptidoglycan-binding protein [Microbacterium resistens]MDR6868019.1 peptidoglycan hydrolase-like protein with peptidoglycan-binding domain [Microbacterium resistens]